MFMMIIIIQFHTYSFVIQNIKQCIIHIDKILNMKIITFVSILFTLQTIFCDLLLSSVEADSATILQTTSYLFQVQRFGDVDPIPANSVVKIYFPNSYSNSGVSSCSPVDWTGDPNLLCSMTNQILTVGGGFSADSLIDSFSIRATGITNPFPAKEYSSFTIRIIYPDNTQQTGTGSLSITITAASATCSSTITDGIVSSRGSVDITFSSNYITDTSTDNYGIKVLMAQAYPSDDEGTDIEPILNVSNTQKGNYIYELDYTQNFKITMLMPPSTQPEDDFITIKSHNDDGDIDACTISITGIEANVFTNLLVSAAQIQTTSDLTFTLQSSSFIMSTDSIVIDFSGTDFDVTGINQFATFSGGVTGSKEITRTSSRLTINNIADLTLVNTVLVFTISDIDMPFTGAQQSITFYTQTSENRIRDQQVYSYSSTIGTFSSPQVSCFTLEIGYQTTCIFSATLIHEMLSTDSLIILLPSGFTISTQTFDCSTSGISGTNINIKSTCNSHNGNNTIQITDLASTNIVPGTKISVTLTITIPSSVSTFSIQMRTQSNGGIIDSGIINMVTEQRQLLQGQITMSSSTTVTNSPVEFTVQFALPLNLGFPYVFQLFIPFTTTNQPSVNNNFLTSTYNNSILTVEGVTSSDTLSITNFLSHTSTQPITLYGDLSFNGSVYFYFSGYDIEMTQPKEISTFSQTQSNDVVGELFMMTFEVSDLVVGDKIIFQNFDLYDVDQQECSSNLICSANGIIEVVSVDVDGVTDIIINFFNPSYAQNAISQNLTVYENNEIYKKQTHSFNIQANQLNYLNVTGEQTNPYYNQDSTYTFNVSLSTSPPVGSSNFVLQVDVSSFNFNNCTCVVGCTCPTSVMAGTLFISITSTSVAFKLGMQNPLTFTAISMVSSISLGQMDEGSYLPQTPCNTPCRSCTSDPDYCQSCYAYLTQDKLRTGTCVQDCSSGEFYQTSTLSCELCDSKCLTCQDNSVNCFTCANPYVFDSLTNECLDECPTGYYSNSFICTQCSTNCIECSSASVCTQCDSSTYLYSDNCIGSCPDGTYINTLTNQNVCYDCDSIFPTCQTCARTICFTCKVSYYFYEGQCLSACQDGTYDSGNFTCSDCVSPCLTCTGQSVCVSCDTTKPLLYNQQCVTSCPDQYYADSTDCLECSAPCLLCTINGCISCENSSYYLSNNQCVQTCSSPLYANNITMKCVTCQSPCRDCIDWYDQCSSCLDPFGMYNGQCVACPQGTFNQNNICKGCPDNCTSCTSLTHCTACDDGTFFYGFVCTQTCQNGTTQQAPYCLSPSCQTLTNCFTCSNTKCIQCESSYELNSTNNKCQQIVTQETVVNSVSEIPVPFPFLIAVILIIIMAFLIQSKFTQMYAPIFIYSIAGIPQVGVLALWIGLLWLYGVDSTSLGTIIKYIGTGIGGIYFIFNIVSFILYLAVIRQDRKYKIWQKQDNRCCSVIITCVGFLFSFRFSLLKYSRLGHLQGFSAKLGTDHRLSHYNGMGIASIILINIPAIVMSGWVGYLQTKMNYLFFTSIQNAVVNVIMIIICIAQLLTPKGYVLEKKDQYKQGHDSENLQGQSLQQIMMGINVIEEEYHEGKEINSMQGDQVIRRNDMDDDTYTDGQIQTSQPFINRKPQDSKIQFDERVVSSILGIIDEKAELQDLLKQAQQFSQNLNRPSRPIGSIRKQIMRSIQESSSQSQSQGLQESVGGDDDVPNIDNPAFSFGGYKKKTNVIKEQQSMSIDDEQKVDRKEGLSKIKALFSYLQQQQRDEKKLRKRLQQVTEEEKMIKKKQFQQARQLMQRNKMTVQDKLSKLYHIFDERNKRQQKRKTKLKQLHQKRKQEREIKSTQPIQIKNFVYNPVDNLEEEEDKGLKKVKVSAKNPLQEEDMIWPQTQQKLNFQQNKQWEIHSEKGSPHSDHNKLSEGKQDSVPKENEDNGDNDDHWPIDPQIEQKILQVQEKANQYIRTKRKKTYVDEFESKEQQQLYSSQTEKFLYQEQQEQEQEEEMGPKINENIPVIEVGSKIKLPKGRVNRDIINLAPQ